MENAIKSSAINYGLYLGGILGLVTVIGYAVSLELLVKWWLGIILLIVIIAFGIISISSSKKMLNGYISFKQAFSSYFFTVAIGILVSMLISILLFNFIDPDAAELLKEKILESTINMMQGFGVPAEAIAEAVDKIENQNQFSILNQLKSVAWQLLFYIILGLILAAIMKKTDPSAE